MLRTLIRGRPAPATMRRLTRTSHLNMSWRALGTKNGNAHYSEEFGDHSWRQQNHIWTEEEIAERKLTSNLKHVPQSFGDALIQKSVRVAYHTFNFLTGYNADDPPVSSIGYRLIILESVAGVPGMLGGMFRHFRSLRQLERDHGFIFTLLEEAENERMHLIVCMNFFEASPLTRFVVSAAQVAMTPFLAGLYLLRPQYLHRFVGYLEETAVHTYTNIVKLSETPGTKLHAAWAGTPAPIAAIHYWKMADDATWVDTLNRMLADESHHRDVNHTLASMPTEALYGKDNPFVHEHIADYEAGVKRRAEEALKRAFKDLDAHRIHVAEKPLA